MSVTSTCVRAKLEGKKVVFFGAGIDCFHTLTEMNYHQKLLVSYICDNNPNKHGGNMMGVPIYHLKTLLEEDKNETFIIITSAIYSLEIAKQLFDLGFCNIFSNYIERANRKLVESDLEKEDGLNIRKRLKKRFEVLSRLDTNKVRGLLADRFSVDTFDKLIEAYKEGSTDYSHINDHKTMYFNDVFRDSMTENEVYLDVGVGNISTIVDFILYTNGRYQKIYAFEPDISVMRTLVNQLSDIPNIELLSCGLSDREGEAAFDMKRPTSSKVVDMNEISDGVLTKIKIVKLDHITILPPTLIKMDIEGGEYDALMGGKETIQRFKPKMAISIYHKDDDLVTLPLLIHEMVPEYKLYLRHHTNWRRETVLYVKP